MSNIYSFRSGQHTPGPFIQMGPELTQLLPNSPNKCHATFIDALFLSVCKCYLLTRTYLVKSTPPDRLLEAIKEIASGGSPMSSHIARKVVQAFQPGAQAAPPLEHLAPREQEVLDLLSKGRAYKQIAAEMDLHIGTVRTYIRRIYEKLHVNCRTDAVVRYLDAATVKAPLSRRR